jgi:hypothetical protein
MPKSFNIKDAINWVAQAWRNVSPSTIQNCWDKTGILVQSPRIDIVDEFINLPDNNETELQSLLNQLSTEHVTVEEYVNLENSVQFNDTITVEDIVQTIQEPSEDELSEDELFKEQLPNISPSEALCALDTLVIYLDQYQTDYPNDTKSVLRNLRRSIAI